MAKCKDAYECYINVLKGKDNDFDKFDKLELAEAYNKYLMTQLVSQTGV